MKIKRIKTLKEWSQKKVDKSWKNYDRRRCTVPQILGFGEWFENRFHDLCHIHDKAWGSRILKRKLFEDIIFCKNVFLRGLIFLKTSEIRDGFASITLSIIAYFWFNTVMFVWWIYKWAEKKTKERANGNS